MVERHSVTRIYTFLFFAVLVLLSLSLTTKFQAKVNALSPTILANLADVAYAAEVPSGTHYNYYLYLKYDSKETITINNSIGFNRNADRGDEANYPEVSFISLLLVQENRETKERHLCTTTNAIKVKIESANAANLHYQLWDLSGLILDDRKKALYDGEVFNKEVEKYSFFLALGKSGAGQMLGNLNGINNTDGKDTPLATAEPKEDKLEIEISGGYAIVAVKTWNHQKANDKLSLRVALASSSIGAVTIVKDNIDIALNIDNVTLLRKEAVKNGARLPAQAPKSGEHYDKNPGRFVVKGAKDPLTGEERTYDQITLILNDAANGLIGPLPADGSIDWLQVAVDDIYKDTNHDVFNCVWSIKSVDLGEASSNVLAKIPYEIGLNPYNQKMRFNEPADTIYHFHLNQCRDSIIYREALRCYQLLPGPAVNDEEAQSLVLFGGNDDLFVNATGTDQNNYLVFSFDHKVRGFLNLDTNKLLTQDVVGAHLQGPFGDKVKHKNLFGRLITRIDDKIDAEQMKKLFSKPRLGVMTVVNFEEPLKLGPQDFPYEEVKIDYFNVPISGQNTPIVFLYVPEKIPTTKPNEFIYGSYPLDFFWLGPEVERMKQITTTAYGEYTHFGAAIKNIRRIKPRGNSKLTPELCYQLLKAGKAQLYALNEVTYKHAPFNYDCDYYAIKRGPRGADE